jgi:transcriptional regulator with XRE-family HTH domain
MDLIKCGAFLKALRNEKGLTQAQLAEQMNVSNRTVSRWETGVNMPDVEVIIALSKLYSVDIKEILEGERKGAETNEIPGSSPTHTPDEKALINAAEYGAAREKRLTRLLLLTSAAIVIIIGAFSYAAHRALLNVTGGDILIFTAVFMFAAFILIMQIPRRNRTSFGCMAIALGGTAALIIGGLVVFLLLFPKGGYRNYGASGLWLCLLILLLSFILCGILVSILTAKQHKTKALVE